MRPDLNHADFCPLQGTDMDHPGSTCREHLQSMSKPYVPSECLEAFQMLRAAPVLEIPRYEMSLRLITLEYHVVALESALRLLSERFEHDHDRLNALYMMPHNKWEPTE
jgi:hypothetical protein